MQKLWIINHAIASITKGIVTIQIEAPKRSAPREEAFGVADKNWLANQLAKIKRAREERLTTEIPLTKEGSFIRLGGGFLHVQGNAIVVPQRDTMTKLRPLVLCECGGVFDTPRYDYLEMMLTESEEIVRLGPDGILYIPQLDGEASRYNKAIEKATISVAKLAGIPFSRTEAISVEILAPLNSVTVRFADSMPFKVSLSSEVDTSSLESVGILRYPALPNVRFQDTECFTKDQKHFRYLARKTHVIDYQTGIDTVWQNGELIRKQVLTKELAEFDLKKTKGRYTNEKLEEVIKNLPFSAPTLQVFHKQPKRIE
jgi:hypothetical protein